MKTPYFLFALFFIVFFSSSCTAQFKIPKSLGEATDMLKGEDDKLSEEDVIAGLKEALTVGTKNATNLASKVDGYSKNPAIFIPFPPEAKAVEDRVRQIGLNEQVDRFVESLNRAAEEAAKEAAPIFIDAVKQMTIQDGWNILKGGNHAATDYLDEKTSQALYNKFKPVVRKAIAKVKVTEYWTPIITTYNKVPFVKKVNPDLEDYTTNKAIDGLFYLVGREEEKIRKDPMARVTDLLKRVFAQAN